MAWGAVLDCVQRESCAAARALQMAAREAFLHAREGYIGLGMSSCVMILRSVVARSLRCVSEADFVKGCACLHLSTFASPKDCASDIRFGLREVLK